MNDINIESIMEKIREHIILDTETTDLSQSYNTLMTAYHRKILERLEIFDEVVVFGAGRYGKMIAKALKSGGIETIKCFCDNDPHIIDSDIDGLPVLLPDMAFKKHPNAAFIITAINYPVEITAQLLKMGIDVGKILFYNFYRSGL